jgi:hypothetical protein
VSRNFYQAALDILPELGPDAYDFGLRSSGETHGVVLTKPHVVSLILDLAGYTADRDLTKVRLLEPSCGEGAFVVPAVERLLTAATRTGVDLRSLSSAITAYDIDPAHVQKSRRAVATLLQGCGVMPDTAALLAESWIRDGDFLLSSDTSPFDAIVGNPPYVRIEQLSSELQRAYRRRFRSLYDRADLYVAFIERGLQLLGSAGVLSFICADRWTVNKYGAPLREIVTSGFRVACYIDLHSASPFESEVIAYPSIFAITPGHGGITQVCRLETASSEECEAVIPAMVEGATSCPGVSVADYETWFSGAEPWTITSPEHLRVLRSLESRFLPIEATGRTRVGIGVATGDDGTYIVGEDADIESDRLVPLVMRADIGRGQIRDARRFVINTFTEDGGVVNLDDFPRLADRKSVV